MKKNFKNIIAVLMILFLVAGCGNKNNKKYDLQLNNNLSVELNSDVTVSRLLDSYNKAEVINLTEKIDTSELGDEKVVIKYMYGDELKEYIANVTVVDTTKPTIKHESKITAEVGSTVDLLQNVIVTDNSNELITPTVEGEYDLKKEGTYYLKYVAIDSSNNKTESNFTLEIIKNDSSSQQGSSGSQSGATKTTYYRYRTKTYKEYACGTYDCSYVDDKNTIKAEVKFSSSSPCGGGVNPQIKIPCITDKCLQVFVPQYKVEGNVCYDSQYIYIQDDQECNGNICSIPKPEVKTKCDSDEIKINGYCHKIESKGTYTCPADYTLTKESLCAKKVQKTCTKTCKSESWSNWSEWSTKKVSPSATVEVQTKTM